MDKYAVIVAGGKGLRMESKTPKQFLELNGLPILMHTINAFKRWNEKVHIVLVLPKEQLAFWEALCNKYHYLFNGEIAIGGKERFESVKNGLEKVEEDSLVAIHDGVRPLVSNETIERCFENAERYGNAIPVIKSVDSIRKIDGEENWSMDRDAIRLVQTPQVFKCDLLKKNYNQSYRKEFTDEASVIEKAGYKIKLVDGNRENIKITTPIDLELARLILKKA